MPTAQAQSEYVGFLHTYMDFLDKMLQDEGEKLKAIQSRELPRIERSIAVSQANAKQLDNYEQRRMELQTDAGFGGMTFRQLIEKAPADEKGALQTLYARFEQAVQEIKFNNDKSMAVARDNLLELDPEAVLAAEHADARQNPYSRIKKTNDENNQNNLLQAKV